MGYTKLENILKGDITDTSLYDFVCNEFDTLSSEEKRSLVRELVHVIDDSKFSDILQGLNSYKEKGSEL